MIKNIPRGLRNQSEYIEQSNRNMAKIVIGNSKRRKTNGRHKNIQLQQ